MATPVLHAAPQRRGAYQHPGLGSAVHLWQRDSAAHELPAGAPPPRAASSPGRAVHWAPGLGGWIFQLVLDFWLQGAEGSRAPQRAL